MSRAVYDEGIGQFEITGKLALPRRSNAIEIAPEGAAAHVNFDLGEARVQRNGDTTVVAIGLMLAGQSRMFACLSLDPTSAKTPGEQLFEAVR